MLFGIAVGILAAFLAGCQTQNVVLGGNPTQSLPRHVVEEGRSQFALEDSYVQRGYGPCGPRCAPTKAAMIVVKRPRPPLFNVIVVGGGNCAPRQRMVRRDCEPQWYERDCVPVDRNCPPQGWNGHPQQGWGQQNLGWPQHGGQQGSSTWGDPNHGPGGYR